MKKLILALSLVATQSWADQGFSCRGPVFDQTGEVIGQGLSLLIASEDGVLKVVDRRSSMSQRYFEIKMEQPLPTDTGYTYRTENTKTGFGVIIHKVNMTAPRDSQVFLYPFQIRDSQVEESFVLDCKVN